LLCVFWFTCYVGVKISWVGDLLVGIDLGDPSAHILERGKRRDVFARICVHIQVCSE